MEDMVAMEEGMAMEVEVMELAMVETTPQIIKCTSITLTMSHN